MASNGGSNTHTANGGTQGDHWNVAQSLSSTENARDAIAMMEKTGDRLQAAM